MTKSVTLLLLTLRTSPMRLRSKMHPWHLLQNLDLVLVYQSTLQPVNTALQDPRKFLWWRAVVKTTVRLNYRWAACCQRTAFHEAVFMNCAAAAEWLQSSLACWGMRSDWQRETALDKQDTHDGSRAQQLRCFLAVPLCPTETALKHCLKLTYVSF